MSALLYVLAYVAVVACVGLIVSKIVGYLKKPLHLRWELYPVAHETHGRAEYGGSYMEDADWWTHKQKSSLLGAIKGFLMEALFLHSTLHNNFSLWVRTYPFHVGFYLVIGALGLTIVGAISQLMGIQALWWNSLIANLTQACNLLGFLGIFIGALGLVHRRCTNKGLRKFSTMEHFFNLGFCAVFSGLGLALWLLAPSFYSYGRDFIANMLSFNFAPIPSGTYMLYLLISLALMVYIPAAFMAHAFMKYFTWHDIRWGDQPTQDNPATQARMMTQLGYRVSWRAPHIKGDGKKTWVEVATTNPNDDVK